MTACGFDKDQLIDSLIVLNGEEISDNTGCVNDYCNTKVKDVCENLKLDINQILKEHWHQEEESIQWKFVCLNIYILKQLKLQLLENDMLSVREIKKLKLSLGNIVSLGILRNLQPNLPLYKAISDEYLDSCADKEISKYNRLTTTISEIIVCVKCTQLRSLIIPEFLKAILAGLYQILYCPIRKPSAIPDKDGFVMTQSLYDRLEKDRLAFKEHFDYLMTSVYKPVYVRETMVLMNVKAPNWFKVAISSNLSIILRSKKGVESVVAAILDGANDDVAKTWNCLEVISKLFISSKNFPDFRDNVCHQLVELLNLKGCSLQVFERVFVTCVKKLYINDKNLCEEVFISYIQNRLLLFTKRNNFRDKQIVTEALKQSIRLINEIFVRFDVQNPPIKIKYLNSVIAIAFRLYLATSKCNLDATNNELQTLIRKYFETIDPAEAFCLLDILLFGINPNNLEDIKELELIADRENITVSFPCHVVAYSSEECGDHLLKIFESKPNLLSVLFTYLLNCLVERDKYFKSSSNKDLLKHEMDFVISEDTEKKLTVFKLLSVLTENKEVQEYINETPNSVVHYIKSVFEKTIESRMHRTNAYESDGFQSIFTLVMVLQALIKSSTKDNLKIYQVLKGPLGSIHQECANAEMKDLLENILRTLTAEENLKPNRSAGKDISELDKAIEDVCDPLLPVRGHGLMTLTRLVEKRDSHAMDRKQYILNIFQQNLKNEDSYIYLSAINGLAALCNWFTDIVLQTLVGEYSDLSDRKTSSDDGHELRMKLGEVLVRVTGMLGEMTPKYKSLLLNAFLVGAKDDDHLIRASSLSNLAEVCRILGYKLGSIVSEILTCVNAILDTDKQIEPRRAAVTVIRQLFVGLETETIAFLKEDILPIYRTLKRIYRDDPDDVMRLQAQLALEELNENMKNLVFPKLELSAEKNVLHLK